MPASDLLALERLRDRNARRGWVRAFAANMERFGTGDTYVNYLGEEGPEAIHAAYGVNYELLARLKRKYRAATGYFPSMTLT